MTHHLNRRYLAPSSLYALAVLYSGLMAIPAFAITIPTVPVGNAGNAPDQIWPHNNFTNLQFGAVPYEYRIGTYEVTNAQYAAFLNAKAASDPLGLYNPNMGINLRGGIMRSGADGSYVYTTRTNMADKPVNYVSWYDAVRFTNWLHNGQGSGDTETGAYTLLGSTPTPSNASSVTRNAGAVWFLPSENEWYKAAYHQPAAQGGDSDDYWLYATATNTQPITATANAFGDINNPGANVANYATGADWHNLNGNVTTVGSAGPSSYSYYGTADQAGNVFEWNETLIIGSFRGWRGGSWDNIADVMQSSFRNSSDPTIESPFIGFRVAAVPEPSTQLLAVLGMIGLLWWSRRRK